MSYENILVETKGRVGVIRFNRPQALNALNAALVGELIAAIDAFEADANIGCLLITGSEKAFAAGADIKEMVEQDLSSRSTCRTSAAARTASRAAASRWSRRWRASRSAAAASSPCRPTSSSPPTPRSSASRRSSSASFRATAARSG